MPVDERVLRRPSTPYIYELRCHNEDCSKTFLQATVQRGAFCPHCGRRDPHNKVPLRMVKADG